MRFVLTFIVTAAWDIILRALSEKRIRLFGLENTTWISALRPYFESHTIVGAACIAGAVGMFTQAILESLGYTSYSNFTDMLSIPVMSALVGIPMRYSGMFPHLKKHYYDKLGFQYTFVLDAFSGIVVAITNFAIQTLYAAIR